MVIEHQVVMGKLLSVLGELGHYPEDYVVRDNGMHRIHTVRITIRVDEDISEDRICQLLDAYNSVGEVKLHLYDIEDYPTEASVFVRLYLSFYI